jgi:hypothetical protein
MLAFAENRNFVEPLSDMNGLLRASRLARYRELMCFGGRIIIERVLNVELFCSLLLPRLQFGSPRVPGTSEKDLYMHTGLASVHCKGTEDIQALCWCSGPVVFPLQFYLLISDKQLQLMLRIWGILQSDSRISPEISEMDLD